MAWATPAHAQACPDLPAEAWTLAVAVARAVCLDPSLAQARAETSRSVAARTETEAASAWQWQLQAGPAAHAQQGSGRDTRNASLSATLGASRTLADGGLQRARVSQRDRELAAAQADLRVREQALALEVVGVWADLREAAASLQAAQTSVQAARASEAAVRARFEAGSATRVDGLAAASTLAQAEREQIVAQGQWQRRQGVLLERLALPASSTVPWTADDLSFVVRLAPTLAGSAVPSAPDDHPQLAAGRERLAARRDGLAATRAEGAPSWSVSARGGPNTAYAHPAALGSASTARQLVGDVALTWSMPLSDGGARQARSLQAQAQLDAQQAQLDSVARNLRENLWTQWTAWQTAPAEQRAAAAALQAAQAAEAAQRGRYEAGAGTLTDWLNAQAERSQRARQAAAAEVAVLRAAAGAAHALGQLNPLPTPLP
jgi:outer membrane protein